MSAPPEPSLGAQKKLAVLIDADNTSASIIGALLDEIATYGIASVKRAYGNWTSETLQPWKKTLLDYSIQPMQQFAYTTGKNATDSALIIDAMDLLYTEKFDGFCIVSSDSDFTRLASRIRESGLTVYGFGERRTPKPFVQACDKFIYTDILGKPEPVAEPKPGAHAEVRPPEKSRRPGEDKNLVNLLKSAAESCSDEDGWAYLADLGNNILQKKPDFDPRNYGYKKLKDLVEDTRLFDIHESSVGDSPAKTIQVRFKKAKRKRGFRG
ncbi:MAG: NYN domain-containing protein [Methanomicrobiales archaeon]